MAQWEFKVINDKLVTYKGMVFPLDGLHEMTAEFIDSLENFKVRDDDLFVVTFPKSGTIWTQRIITLLYADDFPEKAGQITYEQMPWLEFRQKGKEYVARPSPRLYCSHLQQHMMPKELRGRGKIIYVMRNPKDVMVSYFHFAKVLKTLEASENFDEMMEKFYTGLMVGGCWFEHVKGWIANKSKYNILILTYEEMIKDLRSAVVKICEFVGKSLSDAAIDDVVKKTTFSNMKKDPLANYEFIAQNDKDMPNGFFVRKGTVGDWKNSLTVNQSEAFDRIYRERMKNVPVDFAWDLAELQG